jgi:predicted nucleotide-binding protein
VTLPIRTTIEDVDAVCTYLAKKPTGATVAEARKVIDPRHLDGRKLSALKSWGVIDESGGRLKVTPAGRLFATGDQQKKRAVLRSVIKSIPAYFAVVERASHRREESVTATDLAAHWHEHFGDEAGDSDTTLNDQAVCFFQVAASAGLGEIVIGRRGSPTRLQFDQLEADRLANEASSVGKDHNAEEEVNPPAEHSSMTQTQQEEHKSDKPLGQAIFVAHGKNKRPLEQLKKILDQFRVPYRVAIDEPNLGRPIGAKVKETMEACNCAVLIFTADEQFQKLDGSTIWRPSENVVYELGASGYLYSNRIVIVKEDSVEFPANFRDLGYISFEKDNLEAKSMDVLRELIGFGIIKITT